MALSLRSRSIAGIGDDQERGGAPSGAATSDAALHDISRRAMAVLRAKYRFCARLSAPTLAASRTSTDDDLMLVMPPAHGYGQFRGKSLFALAGAAVEIVCDVRGAD